MKESNEAAYDAVVIVRLPLEVKLAAKKEAEKAGRRLSDFVRDVLKQATRLEGHAARL